MSVYSVCTTLYASAIPYSYITHHLGSFSTEQDCDSSLEESCSYISFLIMLFNHLLVSTSLTSILSISFALPNDIHSTAQREYAFSLPANVGLTSY